MTTWVIDHGFVVARMRGTRIDYERMLSVLARLGRYHVALVNGDPRWTTSFQQRFYDRVRAVGVDVRLVPQHGARQRGVDAAIRVLIESAPEHVVLTSGDGNFAAPMARVRGRGHAAVLLLPGSGSVEDDAHVAKSLVAAATRVTWLEDERYRVTTTSRDRLAIAANQELWDSSARCGHSFVEGLTCPDS